MMAPTAAVPTGPALRDIHVPVSADWWPPAPGWWLLGALLAALLVAALLRIHRWWRRRRVWRSVRAELDALARRHAERQDDAELAAGLSALLRRAVIRNDGNANVRGADWQAELERLAPGALGADRIAELEGATYQPRAQWNPTAALAACRHWLQRAIMRHA